MKLGLNVGYRGLGADPDLHEAGVETLTVSPIALDRKERVDQLRAVAELAV